MGLCVDGRILRGKNGNTGHAGRTFVSDNDDALCGGGNAIPRRFGALGYSDFAMLFAAAHAGDARAEAIIEDPCRIMGRTL